eukprot:TRINITY_DN62504_c0_g1_i1.p1 TRINITY_DN62504_c0_g1~~TRINITY_DN62504_c0_g1_i1.p1  ORF type:complete len:821 (+),score=171.49 TRINITY_DN62504_c0_g1_i1:41-2464(+)
MKRTALTVVTEITQCFEDLYGNRLAGWRHELDRDGDMHVAFDEFCTGVSSLREKANFSRASDVVKDWKLVDADNSGRITFEELCPYDGAVLETFRSWMRANFEDPVEMFMDMDRVYGKKAGTVELTTFMSSCESLGLVGTPFLLHTTEDGLFDEEATPQEHHISRDDVECLFRGLVLSNDAKLHVDEVIFLERDPEERAVLRAGWGSKDAMERASKDMNAARILSQASNVRNSVGRWNKTFLEPRSHLQAWTQKLKWEQKQRKLNDRSACELKSFMRFHHGTMIRAWRKALNVEGKNRVLRQEVLQYCCMMNFPGNARAAFAGLDSSDQGFLTIEDMDRYAADDLATFRKQLGSCFGSLELALVALKSRGSTAKHRTNISFDAFRSFILDAMQLRDGDPRQAGHGVIPIRAVFDALDYSGLGLLHLPSDLHFLADQDFLPWAGAMPDPEATKLFFQELIRRHGNYISAWLHLLDRDSSNEVTWTEFVESCKEIGFHENVAGVWRQLDENFSGYLSLSEIDTESHATLCSFKTWAHANCGSVLAAFEVLDRDSSGDMNCQEFRKSSKFFGWAGDAGALFNALALAPKRRSQEVTITKKDVEFLDYWPVQPSRKKGQQELQKVPEQLSQEALYQSVSQALGMKQRCNSTSLLVGRTQSVSAGTAEVPKSPSSLRSRARRPLSASAGGLKLSTSQPRSRPPVQATPTLAASAVRKMPEAHEKDCLWDAEWHRSIDAAKMIYSEAKATLTMSPMSCAGKTMSVPPLASTVKRSPQQRGQRCGTFDFDATAEGLMGTIDLRDFASYRPSNWL